MALSNLERPSMKRFAPLVVAAAALVSLLSGCAPDASASPDDSPKPTASSDAETPIVASTPTSRVPLRCDQLASSSAVASAVGQPIGVVSPISVDLVPTLEPYASVQHGDLECAWSPTPLTYNVTPPIVSILVVPEVTAAQWSDVVGRLGDATEGGFAGDSHSSCTSDGDISECRLDTLVNGYWLGVSATAFDGGATAESTAELFRAAASAVESAATATSVWILPSDAGTSGTIDTSLASAALGATVEQIDCDPTTEAQKHWVATAATGYTACTYSANGIDGGADAFVTVYFLPGGAWALQGATTALGAQATPATGVGDGALSVADGPGASTTMFARGSDLVAVHSNGSGEIELTPQILTSIPVAVAGALPAA